MDQMTLSSVESITKFTMHWKDNAIYSQETAIKIKKLKQKKSQTLKADVAKM
jgi:hypothetical protein